MFPQEDSLRLFCCHRGHNEETKSVEFAFVAICLRLTHHNDCTKGIMTIIQGYICYPELSRVAVGILVIAPENASCERAFSIMKFIKKINVLVIHNCI